MGPSASKLRDRLKLVGCACLFVALPLAMGAAAYMIDRLIAADLPMPSIKNLLGPLMLTMGASAAGYGGWLTWKSACQFLFWKSVEGTVTRSKVQELQARYVSHPQEIHDAALSSHWRTEYRVDVHYSYEVGGQSYFGQWRAVPYVRGTQFRRLDFSHRTDAEAIVQRYPAGGTIRVFYHPQRPGESTVHRGYFSRGLTFVAVGTVAWLLTWLLW